jgi:hypothetical protein
MRGIAKALKAASAVLPGIERTVSMIEKLMGDFHRDVIREAGEVSPGFGKLIDALLKAIENGVTVESLLFPTSEFAKFKFHDLSPKHNVVECNNKNARRNVFSVAGFRAMDIEFDGAVPNDWSLFMADVKIKTNTLAWICISSPEHDGAFKLIKSNYYVDIAVNAVNVVTD